MHNLEKKEDNSLKGKLVAFFDIKKDPLVKKFQPPQQEEDNEAGKGWGRGGRGEAQRLR